MTEKIVVLKEDVESVLHTLIQNDLEIRREHYNVHVNNVYAVVSFEKSAASSYMVLQEKNKYKIGETCKVTSFEEHLKSLTNNNIKPAFSYNEEGIISKMYFSLNYQIKI